MHQLIHTILNDLLGSGIDGAGCLVKNQNRRVCNCGAGDGKKLTLTLT